MSVEKEKLASWIDGRSETLGKFADAIWHYAELGCEEYRSSKLLQDLLESHGFEVRSGRDG